MFVSSRYRSFLIITLVVSLVFSVFQLTTSCTVTANKPDTTGDATTQPVAPLLNNLGSHHHEISTSSKLAQRYFDQGLILAYGFNHAEAARSFRAGAELDPNCAMCYWGLAYVLGPNINAAMEEDAVPEAWQAISKAVELSSHATAQEQDYIKALAKRYNNQVTTDRTALDLAYAQAMAELVQRYPDDLDAATLYAEALMDTTAWDYWQENGKPKPETIKILATLDSVLERNQQHPGANHFYIHAVEAQHPELGIAAAERLGDLVPRAGHLVHMPAHIYIRVGRYHDAVVANQKAIAADRDYITQCHAQGLYPLAYMPHNQHFLWYAATMSGQSEVAMTAAQQTAAMVDQKLIREPGYGTLQHFSVMPLYTLVKFGQWKEILAQPSPAEDLKYPQGVWHYARGMALAAQGKLEAANQELKALSAIASDPELESVTIWDINTTASLVQIATQVLAGEIAFQQGDYEQAIKALEAAVVLDDELNYDEPDPWYSPVRQSLGAVLLKANRPEQAEQIYRQDLATYAENGWSLQGLAQSLQAQGKIKEARAVEQRFAQAWQYADVTLSSSTF